MIKLPEIKILHTWDFSMSWLSTDFGVHVNYTHSELRGAGMTDDR